MPSLAAPAETAYPAGGPGGGHFTFARTGEFRDWRLQPGLPAMPGAAPWNRFHVWARRGRHTEAGVLVDPAVALAVGSPWGEAHRLRRLFPFTWLEVEPAGGGPRADLQLACLTFSPLLPDRPEEACLPIWIAVWRARNDGLTDMEAAFLLTWAGASPEPDPASAFDFQHDRLCLTGALGDPLSPDRSGIALPDLHSEGIYQQGIEPWEVEADGEAVWEDFAGDGEIDPSIARNTPQGASAWVKFDLAPGETKEVPFVIAWHQPVYRSGPFAGQPRYYTRYLEKRRPDNAIVWLAEQAVQNYGAETANYRYWIQQIQDAQQLVLDDPTLSPDEKRARLEAPVALYDADITWAVGDQRAALPRTDHAADATIAPDTIASLLDTLWPRRG